MGRGPRGSGGPRRLGGNWVQTAECGSVLAPRALRWRPCIGRAVLERVLEQPAGVDMLG